MNILHHSNLIGTNIRRIRQQKNIKGATLGRILGVSNSSISQIENGLIEIKYSTIQSIATALDVNICCLLPITCQLKSISISNGKVDCKDLNSLSTTILLNDVKSLLQLIYNRNSSLGN